MLELLRDMAQLTSKFTSKRERLHKPRRIFKSAHELLMCTRLLHECEILVSICLCSCVVHTSQAVQTRVMG